MLHIPTGKLIIFHRVRLKATEPADVQRFASLRVHNFVTPSVTIIVAARAIKAKINVVNPIGKRSKRSVRKTRRKTTCIQSEMNERAKADR